MCAGPLRAWSPATAFHVIWDSAPGLLPVSAASPSMDHERGTVCKLIPEHQIQLCVPSRVISRAICFNSSLRCCWQVGSASFNRRRCDSLAKYSDLLIIIIIIIIINCPVFNERERRVRDVLDGSTSNGRTCTMRGNFRFCVSCAKTRHSRRQPLSVLPVMPTEHICTF